MKISREIKAAIIVISSLLLFIWGFSFLKGSDLLTSNKTLYFHLENVEGLSTASIVTYNGLPIGKVNNISFDAKNLTNLVEIMVQSNIPISKTSIAKIYEPSPIGAKTVAIVHDATNQEMVQNKDFLKSEVALGMLSQVTSSLKPIEQKLTTLLDDADVTVKSINEVLDEKTKENLRNSMESLSITLAQLTQTTKTINAMLAENQSSIKSSTKNLEKVTGNFSKISDSLAAANWLQTMKSLEKTLQSVDGLMADLQAGKGTMGKLMKDEKMYQNLEGASRELEQLLADFKKNPKRYVHFSLFGKKNEAYQSTKRDSIVIKYD